jgi:hypothetical protein
MEKKMSEHIIKTRQGTVVVDPPIAKLLFSDTRLAAVWTVIRVLLGFAWLEAGWDKTTDPTWMQTGEALQGYWARAVAIPEQGRPAITFDWYRSCLQGMIRIDFYLNLGYFRRFQPFIMPSNQALGTFSTSSDVCIDNNLHQIGCWETFNT